MGRLTLNILLSFAQFEREVIGERIRDKIAASKVPPLGYRVQERKLVIVDAAQRIRSLVHDADQMRGNVIQRAPAFVETVPFDKTDQHQGRSRRRQDAIKGDQHHRADDKADEAIQRDAADPPQQAGFGTGGAS
jgi:hypothetical protein